MVPPFQGMFQHMKDRTLTADSVESAEEWRVSVQARHAVSAFALFLARLWHIPFRLSRTEWMKGAAPFQWQNGFRLAPASKPANLCRPFRASDRLWNLSPGRCPGLD